uniref:lysophospholipid acyltransferase 5 isoform X2 n=1 Tax=Myxine glutinosa TaxID=7769 RepID=UPI00358EF7CF
MAAAAESGEDTSALARLAWTLGSSEPALRLLLSLLVGYPLAAIQRTLLFGCNPTFHHVFYTLTGLCLAYFNFGVAFDYYDGGKPKDKLTAEQAVMAVSQPPTCKELFSFTFFFGGFLVGPQFGLRRFRDLVCSRLTDQQGHPPRSLWPALKRLTLGMLYITVFAIASVRFPDNYLLSSDYQEQPFWFRCMYIALWGKFALCKYVSCWLIAEGVCILTGLGWTGTDASPGKQVNPKLGWASDGWDACSNVRILLFETTVHFTGKIVSFNTNTNSWAARYVFKRLRFLGSKLVSQAVTLMFLAVWHGLHSGYFVCFSLELLIVFTERKTLEFVDSIPKLKHVTSLRPVRFLLYPPLYLFQMMFLSYPLVPFCLFSWEKWLRVYSSVYFVGHLTFIVVLLVLPLLRVALPSSKHQRTKDD